MSLTGSFAAGKDRHAAEIPFAMAKSFAGIGNIIQTALKKESWMKEKLIKTMDLENGMQLNFYDASKKLVGDRWLISLVVRMEIPVTDVLIKDPGQSTQSVKEIKSVLGENLLFEQKRERNFIDEAQKEEMFKELYDTFVNSTFVYLSNEAFPRKYIAKKYKEAVEKGSWYH